jgi:adenosylmethionine-8-amino-7-oxononanoate aminotransferase
MQTRSYAELLDGTIDTLWRPFTQHAAGARPMVLVEGHGCTVVDANGNEYIDAMAGLWCVNVGYGEERLVEAAAKQMRQLPYSSLVRPAPAALELSDRMQQILPGDLNHVIFVNSGSEAVETAIKMARQYARQRYPHENRFKIIARYRGYHGWTGGALGATGQTVRKAPFEPVMAGFIHVRPPDTFRLYGGMSPSEAARRLAQELEEVIEFEGPETIAAFIGEPIIGGGGLIVPPDEYWPTVREICDRYGILLIHDEVITGFGRTGTMFGCENWGVVPDIMTMAKGISSAYIPLAATAARDHVFEAFLGEPSENVQFNQLSTYGGHPVACAVAIANLDVMADKDLVANSARMGERLLAGLKELQKQHPVIGDVRGRGLLCGIELARPGTTEPLAAAQVNQVLAEAQKRGVIVGKNVATVQRLECVVTMAPPLVINEGEIERIVDALDGALGTLGA